MINYLKTNSDGKLEKLSEAENGCWISVTAPDDSEVRLLKEKYDVVPEFLKAALDPEETSHIDTDPEESQILIIADCCLKRSSSVNGILSCITVPISLIFMPERIITISIEPNPFLQDLESGKIKDLNTAERTRFFLLLMYMISQKYQLYLRQIEACSEKTTDRLYRNMNNRGIADMMELDKSLIYFSASLKADGNTLEKITGGRILPLNDLDAQLLDDVLIEYRQATDMCQIYTTINERVSNGCNSILSNNMNDIMKNLTVITIVMSIPNMIYGFYGMNVADLPIPYVWFPFLISVISCLICWAYFKISQRFK